MATLSPATSVQKQVGVVVVGYYIFQFYHCEVSLAIYCFFCCFFNDFTKIGQ